MPTRQFHLRPLGKTMTASWFAFGYDFTIESVQPPTEALGLFGTGLRLPGNTSTRSGNNYVAGDMAIGTPNYSIEEMWLFFPAFAAAVSSPNSEVDCPNGCTVEGIAVRGADGTRVLGMINDGTAPVVIDTSNPAHEFGRWIKFTPANPLPANSVVRLSFAQFIPDGLYPRARPTTAATANIFGGTTLDERSEGSTSSLLSRLDGDSTNFSNTNGGVIFPCAAMAAKPAGEHCALILGDSIGHGSHMATNAAVWTDRHEFGFMALGLDDNQSSRRIAYNNWSIPSWGSEATGTTNSQANPDACGRQLWVMERAREINAGRPIVDSIWCEHGSNTSGDQAAVVAGYRALVALWKPIVGDETTPVYQSEMLPYPNSTDGFATLINQSNPASRVYPGGTRWLVNEDIGGPDGLGDPMATLRADGTFQGSFAPWRVSAANLTDQRNLLSVRPFNTTLAVDYTSGTASLVDQPAPGAYLSFFDGTKTGGFVVTSVSGTGPFTCTLAPFTNPGGTFLTANTVVQEMWHDTVGLHPGPLGHIAYAEDAVIPFKVALGFTADPVAPEISAVSAPGAVEDGETISVSYSVTGSPLPTVSVQPQVNGVDAGSPFSASAIGFSYLVDGGALGIANGQTLSFEITATNASGSDTAEPSMSYSSGATSLIDTGDFTGFQTDANNSAILSANSFELARQPSGGITAGPEFRFTLAPGNYRFRFTLADFRGGVDPNITTRDLQLRDGSTQLFRTGVAGPFDQTVTVTTGTQMNFRAPSTGLGSTITGLLVTAA